MDKIEIPHLDGYEEYLTLEKRLSSNTIESYLGDISNYFKYQQEIDSTSNIAKTSTIFKSYFEELSELGVAPRSLSRNISSLKGFYNYLLSEDIIANNPLDEIRAPKIQKYKPGFLDRTETEAIYNSIDLQTKGGKRDFCLIDLLYGAGLRISEAINLSLDKIMKKEGLLLIQGKGNKQRLVPIGKKVQNSIDRFINTERPLFNPSTSNLITNQRGAALSRMGAWKIIQKIAQRADIQKKVYPHTFRHTYASHLIEAGADLRAVQELLGHSDISTTEIYTHLNQDYLFEVHQSFHPRNKNK